MRRACLRPTRLLIRRFFNRMFVLLRPNRLLPVRRRVLVACSGSIGSAEHGQDRSEQPDHGKALHTSATARNVSEPHPMLALAADVHIHTRP